MDASILVTGASSGIGRATAALLSERGARVFAAARSEAALQALAGQAPAGRIVPLPMDVQDPASVDRGMAEVHRVLEGKGLDAIVHCAGYAQPGPLEILTDDALRSQFETNVFGLLRVTRAALPAMRARGRGRIVVMGSIAGRFSTPNLGAYQASKHALEAISDTLRLELAPFGIQVVLVEAGLVRTHLDERALEVQRPFAEIASPYQTFLAHTPQLLAASRRLACAPEEVAQVVAWAAVYPADEWPMSRARFGGLCSRRGLGQLRRWAEVVVNPRGGSSESEPDPWADWDGEDSAVGAQDDAGGAAGAREGDCA